MNSRRGVSLMEVMFAIGVIAIGLLGVIAVIPFGLSQVGSGNVADRSSRLGLSAVDDFEVRGMRRPDSWIHADGTPVQSPSRLPSIASPAAPYLPIGYSFCIDPRFIAATENQTSTGLPLVAGSLDARFFPYYRWSTAPAPGPPAASPAWLFNNIYNAAPPPTSPATTSPVVPFFQNILHPRMIRITLRDSVGTPLNLGPPPGALPYDLGARMERSHADRIFLSDDDLIFEVPDEKDVPPIQDYAGDIRRQYDAETSWMATLVPRSDFVGFSSTTYTLSVIILSHRTRPIMFDDLDADGMVDAGEESNNERIVSVLSFEGSGFAGGDVTLQASTAEALALKEGEWLMLGGSAGVGGIEAPEFRWYRVVATDKVPDFVGSGDYRRVATLQGSDWQRSEWHLPSGNVLFRPTEATLVTGAVAVYEKLIELETTVAWPQ